jgi:NitT/TauT family transport system substrate-binding protein
MGALVLALAVAACAGGGAGEEGNGMTRVELQAQWLPSIEWGPYLYGIEHGIFERHGIELEMISGQGTAFSMLQLAEGRVHFAQGELIGHVADLAANATATTGVLVVIDSPRLGVLSTIPAESLEDLVGHRIAISPFSSFRFTLPIVLETMGLGSDAIEIDLIQTVPALLAERRVEAMMVAPGGDLEVTQAALDAAGIPAYRLDARDFGLLGYFSVIVASDEIIERDPELVGRFVAAIGESVDAALAADPDEIIDLVAALVPGLDRSLALVQWEELWGYFGVGGFAMEVVEANLEYVRQGLGLDHDVGPADVFTNEFLP